MLVRLPCTIPYIVSTKLPRTCLLKPTTKLDQRPSSCLINPSLLFAPHGRSESGYYRLYSESLQLLAVTPASFVTWLTASSSLPFYLRREPLLLSCFLNTSTWPPPPPPSSTLAHLTPFFLFRFLFLQQSNSQPTITAKMPCLRGIEVFLSTKPDGKHIPEYPHPDSSSARVLGTGDRRRVSPFISPGNQEMRHPKSNPTASVYIPSVPGKLVLYDSSSALSFLTPSRVRLHHPL